MPRLKVRADIGASGRRHYIVIHLKGKNKNSSFRDAHFLPSVNMAMLSPEHRQAMNL
jgi:hypothetical protein